MERFIGGNLTSVLARLIILSVIVGVVLAALGLDPFDIFEGVRRLAERIYNMGYEAFEKGVSYFLTGALLVVPIWFVARLFKTGRSKKK
ncbi:MAG: integrase [bacterium]|nr:integrase [bacterium]